MRLGRMLKPGDVVLTNFQYSDTFEIKRRPALVLYEEYNNVVLAGITSNLKMKGIPLLKKEGAIKDSVIKLNYIYTTSVILIEKKLFEVSKKKKRIIYKELLNRLRFFNI